MKYETVIPDNVTECRHENVTLCQCYCEDGRFRAYQCDDCGWVTNQDPPPEDIGNEADLPMLDETMWQSATDRWLKRLVKRNETQVNAAVFFSRATYQGG